MSPTMAIRSDLGRMHRTMGRVNVSPRSLRSAKRCLFDEVDHAEVQRQLAVESQQRYDHFCAKYNFDLRTETPLPGRYDWNDAALVLSTTTTPLRSVTTVASDASEDVPSAVIAPAPEVTSPRPRRESESRQVSLIEFFQSRKRKSQDSDKMTSPVPPRVLRELPPAQLPMGGDQ